MDKERLFGIEDGFSEKQIDLKMDQDQQNDRVVSGNVFVAPSQKQKKKDKNSGNI